MTITEVPTTGDGGSRAAAQDEATRPSGGPGLAPPPTRLPDDGAARRHRGVRRSVAVLAALACGAAVTAVGYAVDARRDAGADAPLGPGVVTVEIGIQHSRFSVGDLRVHEGTVVRFVVRNDDPIDHELVVGDDAVHARHAAGSEARHPPVPGEVSVPAGRSAMTFVELTEPGTLVYACHLPGHLAYGMVGEIEVVPLS